MNTRILEELGMTKNEVKVYLRLLELGATPAGPLVKKLGMHRAAVYNLLDLLLDKGIISYVRKHNRKYFTAHEPKRLLEYVETKKRQLQDKEQELKQLIPELELRKQLAKEEEEGTIYKGKRGIKTILEDVLEQKKDLLVFGAEGKFKELFPWYFSHWHKQRAERQIPLKIIFNQRLTKQRQSLPRAKVKFLSESYINPATTLVYADTVAIIIWEPNPQAFVIKSKQVSQSYRNFFVLLWNTARK